MSANAETSDKVVGVVITTFVHALLFIIFLFMVVSIEIPEEPMGDGNTLEVSYGSDDEGSGDIEDQPAAQQVAAAQPENNPDDNMLTSDVSDAAIVVKKKDDKPKKKIVKEQLTKTDAVKEREVDSDLQGLKDMFGKGGQGDDDKEGNEGGDGTDPGSGKGLGKGGPGGKGNKPTLVSTHKQRHATYDCQEEGIQKVKVKINRSGNVVGATGNQAGTTNVANCLKSKAEKLAKEETYNADSRGPEFREYITSFDFYLQ